MLFSLLTMSFLKHLFCMLVGILLLLLVWVLAISFLSRLMLQSNILSNLSRSLAVAGKDCPFVQTSSEKHTLRSWISLVIQWSVLVYCSLIVFVGLVMYNHSTMAISVALYLWCNVNIVCKIWYICSLAMNFFSAVESPVFLKSIMERFFFFHVNSVENCSSSY